MVSDVEEFLGGMLPRQLAAEHALCRGDAGLRWETWSQRDPVTLFGAAAPVRRGWAELSSTFRLLASRFSDLRDYEFELVAAARHAESCETCGEYSERIAMVVRTLRESEPLIARRELVPAMRVRRRTVRRRAMTAAAGATAVAAAALLGAFVSASREPAPLPAKPMVVAYLDLKTLHQVHQLGDHYPLQPAGGTARDYRLG